MSALKWRLPRPLRRPIPTQPSAGQIQRASTPNQAATFLDPIESRFSPVPSYSNCRHAILQIPPSPARRMSPDDERAPAVHHLRRPPRAGPLRRPGRAAQQSQGPHQEDVLPGELKLNGRDVVCCRSGGEGNELTFPPRRSCLARPFDSQLSKKYHPDVPAPEGESAESRTSKFHAVSEAYHTLSDDGEPADTSFPPARTRQRHSRPSASLRLRESHR